MSSKKLAARQKASFKKKVDWKALDIVDPDAAGIDVGGSEHWVAVNPDRDPESGAAIWMFYRGSA